MRCLADALRIGIKVTKHGDHLDFSVMLPSGAAARFCCDAGVDRRQARALARRQTKQLWAQLEARAALVGAATEGSRHDG